MYYITKNRYIMTGLKFIYFIYCEIHVVSMIFFRPLKLDYHHIVSDIFFYEILKRN